MVDQTICLLTESVKGAAITPAVLPAPFVIYLDRAHNQRAPLHHTGRPLSGPIVPNRRFRRSDSLKSVHFAQEGTIVESGIDRRRVRSLLTCIDTTLID